MGENMNKRKISCLEKSKNVKKLHQKHQNSSIKLKTPESPTSKMNDERVIIEPQSYKNTEPCFKPEVEARTISTDSETHINGMKNFEVMFSEILNKSSSLSSGSFNSEKENTNKRKISHSERTKNVKKLYQKDQNSS